MGTLTTEQIVNISQWVVTAIIFAGLLCLQHKQHANTIEALTATIKAIQAAPAAMENAKAAGAGVPQEAYNKLYGLTDGLIGLLGSDTPVGGLLKQGEDLVKQIDTDPTNDPKIGGANTVLLGSSSGSTGTSNTSNSVPTTP